MPSDQQDGNLSADEQRFFETGDASVLNLATDPVDEAPAPAPTEAPTAAPAAAPEVSPAEIALENERQRRIDLERQLAEARTSKPAAREEELPDPTTDPIGHMIARMERMNREQAELRNQLAEEQQKAALREQWNEFATNVRSIKDEFAKTTPDFDAAYSHLRNIKIADLVDAGMSRAEAVKRLNQDELQLAANALERGKNPAEIVYNMAKRYGYAPQAAAKDEPAQQRQAEEKVARLANGQFASRAPQRSAPPAKDNLTLEGLKDAGEADLNRIATDDKLWAQVVGGKPGGDIFHH